MSEKIQFPQKPWAVSQHIVLRRRRWHAKLLCGLEKCSSDEEVMNFRNMRWRMGYQNKFLSSKIVTKPRRTLDAIERPPPITVVNIIQNISFVLKFYRQKMLQKELKK